MQYLLVELESDKNISLFFLSKVGDLKNPVLCVF